MQDKVRLQNQEAEACRKLHWEDQAQTEEQYKRELEKAANISAKLNEMGKGQVKASPRTLLMGVAVEGSKQGNFFEPAYL